MTGISTNYINMYDLIICFTNAFDLVSPALANHHQQVAYLALRIAERMGLSSEQKKDMMLAGLLHDVGAFSLSERLEMIENEPVAVHDHAFRGARLLEEFSPLRGASKIINYHHIPWNNGKGQHFNGKDIPVSSHILHLADRVSASLDSNRDVISQSKYIREKIKEGRGTLFMPEAVDAFLEISNQEYIWLDLVYKQLLYTLPQIMSFEVVQLGIDEVIDLTRIFSAIIDFRSPFTANHSAGVAATAQKLAELIGFSKNECKMMLIAGYLHDLGKLAVKNEILEKHGTLNDTEYDEVRSHPFYTFRLLQTINGFETINKWASFHHEKLNGTGYPFHLKAESLPLGSRIMAVADIFTAITEDRPYRKGMERSQAEAVLKSLVDEGSICPYVVSVLLEDYDEINRIRKSAQNKAFAEYGHLMEN